MVKINWMPKNLKNGLSQIYSSGLSFALISANNEQATQEKFCKDWIQDAIYSVLHQEPVGIHGFKYDPKLNFPVDMENTRICVGNNKDPEMGQKIDNVIEFLNKVEEAFGLSFSSAEKVENPMEGYKENYVITGPKEWMHAPPLISLYTLLIRVGFCHTHGKDWRTDTIQGVASGSIPQYQNNDRSYLNSSLVTIDKMVKIGYKIFFHEDIKANYPKGVSMSHLHHQSGIVSLSTGGSSSIFPFWSRPEINNAPALDLTKIKEAQKIRKATNKKDLVQS